MCCLQSPILPQLTCPVNELDPYHECGGWGYCYMGECRCDCTCDPGAGCVEKPNCMHCVLPPFGAGADYTACASQYPQSECLLREVEVLTGVAVWQWDGILPDGSSVVAEDAKSGFAFPPPPALCKS
jgi:hypothetical protein